MTAPKVIPVLLCIIHLVATELSTEDLWFEAYDCSQPSQVRPIGVAHSQECKRQPTPEKLEPAKYLVLQESKFRRTKAIRCYMEETQVTMHCGAMDHQTYAPNWSHYNIPKSVSKADCQKYWETQNYHVARGDRNFKLIRNAVNIFDFENSGSTEYHSEEVECEGGSIYHNGKEYKGNVQHIQRSLKIEEIDILIDDNDGVILNKDQVRLPCTLNDETCETSQGRVNWQPLRPQDRCQLYLARNTIGVNVIAGDKTVYMTRDGSRIRLQHAHETRKCGYVVIATTYPNVYLAPSRHIHEGPLLRSLPTPEISLQTYAKLNDEYIYNRITEKVKEEFVAVQTRVCQSQMNNHQKQLNSKLTRQTAAIDGTTITLGGGFFATASGETWYQYACKRRVVRARTSATQCFSALPINMTSRDGFEYWSKRHPETVSAHLNHQVPSMPPLYLEPVSRRIVTIGIPVPCVTEFAPMYQNTNQKWLKLTPTPTFTTAPEQPIETDTFPVETSHIDELLRDAQSGFHDSGLYTGAKLDQWDTFQMAPRLTNDLGINMAASNNQTSGIEPDTDFDNFFDHQNVVQLDPTNWSDQMLDSLRDYAKYVLYFLVLCLTIRGCTWVIGVYLRYKHVRRQCGAAPSLYGAARQLTGAFLPALAQTLAPTLLEVRQEIKDQTYETADSAQVTFPLRYSHLALFGTTDKRFGYHLLPPKFMPGGAELADRQVRITLKQLAEQVLEHQLAINSLMDEPARRQPTLMRNKKTRQSFHAMPYLRPRSVTSSESTGLSVARPSAPPAPTPASALAPLPQPPPLPAVPHPSAAAVPSTSVDGNIINASAMRDTRNRRSDPPPYQNICQPRPPLPMIRPRARTERGRSVGSGGEEP